MPTFVLWPRLRSRASSYRSPAAYNNLNRDSNRNQSADTALCASEIGRVAAVIPSLCRLASLEFCGARSARPGPARSRVHTGTGVRAAAAARSVPASAPGTPKASGPVPAQNPESCVEPRGGRAAARRAPEAKPLKPPPGAGRNRARRPGGLGSRRPARVRTDRAGSEPIGRTASRCQP